MPRVLPRSGSTPQPRVAQRTLGEGIMPSRSTPKGLDKPRRRLSNPFGVDNVLLGGRFPGCAARPWPVLCYRFAVKTTAVALGVAESRTVI
jgi:hypothetical protein